MVVYWLYINGDYPKLYDISSTVTDISSSVVDNLSSLIC